MGGEEPWRDFLGGNVAGNYVRRGEIIIGSYFANLLELPNQTDREKKKG